MVNLTSIFTYIQPSSLKYVLIWRMPLWIPSELIFYPSILTVKNPWWRHRMETFSALLALWSGNSPVTGEFNSQRLVTRSFDVFVDLRLNKRLCKQSVRRWFETHRAHYDVAAMRDGRPWVANSGKSMWMGCLPRTNTCGQCGERSQMDFMSFGFDENVIYQCRKQFSVRFEVPIKWPPTWQTHLS